MTFNMIDTRNLYRQIGTLCLKKYALKNELPLKGSYVNIFPYITVCSNDSFFYDFKEISRTILNII